LRYDAAVSHFGEYDWNHGFLNGFEVRKTQVADGKRIAYAAKEDREVVHPCVVRLACAEGEESGILFGFVE
jgi:hypothetical protein